MSWRFNSCTVSENDKEAKLKCRLEGFKPSEGSHSAYAKVTDNTLVVTANMGDKTHTLKVPDIGLGSDAVNCKPAKDEIKVVITKPSKEFNLQSKMPK